MEAIVKRSAAADDIGFMKVVTPDIAPGEILVRVHAIGVGIHDGYYFPPQITYPYVIGIEAAGVIEKIGASVSGHAVGDRIAFISDMQPKGGTWAEHAVVAADAMIIAVPDAMEFTYAAALPVAGNTILKAFHALTQAGNNSVFIAGASGAVGTLAIQIAAQQQIRVAASASQANLDYMASLGAEKPVDYRDATWQKQVLDWCPGGVDAAIAIQPNTSVDSMAVVKDGGEIISISRDQFTPERGITVRELPHNVDVSGELGDLMRRIANDEMRLTIEKVYPFSQALDALAKVSTRHARGKVVIAGR